MSMELDHSFTVPVPPEQAWDVLLDVEKVAPCMPGAQVDTVDGDDVAGAEGQGGTGFADLQGDGLVQGPGRADRSVLVEASGKEMRGAGNRLGHRPGRAAPGERLQSGQRDPGHAAHHAERDRPSRAVRPGSDHRGGFAADRQVRGQPRAPARLRRGDRPGPGLGLGSNPGRSPSPGLSFRRRLHLHPHLAGLAATSPASTPTSPTSTPTSPTSADTSAPPVSGATSTAAVASSDTSTSAASRSASAPVTSGGASAPSASASSAAHPSPVGVADSGETAHAADMAAPDTASAAPSCGVGPRPRPVRAGAVQPVPVQHQDESLDLLSLVGPVILKRLAPVVGAAVAVGLVTWGTRRLRRRRSA